jgi:putative transposase
MTLSVNRLLEWAEGAVMRVLWFNARDAALIEVNNPQALPSLYSRKALDAALLHDKARLMEMDPYLPTSLSDEQLTDAARKRRDHAWAAIRPLVEAHIPALFLRDERGNVVTQRAAEVGVSKTTLYAYLRRYWQGGQTPNALLPGFHACGAPGGARRDRGRKRGRPRTHSTAQGVNITSEMRASFRKGIRRFYESGEVRSLRDAYQRTLEYYFSRGVDVQDGVPVPILPTVDELPTFGQFRYWYYRDRDLTGSLVKREGQNRYNREYRPLLGESTGMAFGPGSVYQIDATVGDIYLVSELNPHQIIGRPIIYLVVDVFSRMVVGLSVTLEGPSWLGAMLALENATTDKTAFCGQYGVTLDGDEWPCHHLPEMLLADRGELEGYNGDQIVYALNIVVSNTAPYRADMKGIVEQCFRLTNLRVLNTLPGAVREQEPGASDYRLGASLTLSQLTVLLIRGILYHNRHHHMADYPLDRAMLRDGVEPCPLDLWRWGIENRSGHLRTLPVETIRLGLLPQDEAAITRQGIRFRRLYYTCPTAVEAGWYVKAGQSGRWKVPVSYDPRLVDWLYLWHDGGRQVEACTLVNNARMRVFQGLDWATVQTHASYQKGQQQAAQARQQQGRAVLNAHKDDVVQQAETAQSGEKRKRRQVRDIIANRQDERARQRQEEAWRLADAIQPEADEADEGYVPPAQYLDLLCGEETDHDND